MKKAKGGFRALQVRIDEPAQSWLTGLDGRSKEGRGLRRSYEHAVDLVAANFLHGEVVPVPRDARFDGITNLRCEDLAASHRMLYTNVRVEEGTIVLIIDVVSHREYDRLFASARSDAQSNGSGTSAHTATGKRYCVTMTRSSS